LKVSRLESTVEYFPKQEFLEGAEQARASKTSDEQDLESFAI